MRDHTQKIRSESWHEYQGEHQREDKSEGQRERWGECQRESQGNVRTKARGKGAANVRAKVEVKARAKARVNVSVKTKANEGRRKNAPLPQCDNGAEYKNPTYSRRFTTSFAAIPLFFARDSRLYTRLHPLKATPRLEDIARNSREQNTWIYKPLTWCFTCTLRLVSIKRTSCTPPSAPGSKLAPKMYIQPQF